MASEKCDQEISLANNSIVDEENYDLDEDLSVDDVMSQMEIVLDEEKEQIYEVIDSIDEGVVEEEEKRDESERKKTEKDEEEKRRIERELKRDRSREEDAKIEKELYAKKKKLDEEAREIGNQLREIKEKQNAEFFKNKRAAELIRYRRYPENRAADVLKDLERKSVEANQAALM